MAAPKQGSKLIIFSRFKWETVRKDFSESNSNQKKLGKTSILMSIYMTLKKSRNPWWYSVLNLKKINL